MFCGVLDFEKEKWERGFELCDAAQGEFNMHNVDTRMFKNSLPPYKRL
jgi:hypothetical protein